MQTESATASNPVLRSVPSRAAWKAGIDLGASTTVYHEIITGRGGKSVASSSVLPTAIAYPAPGGGGTPAAPEHFLVGQAALKNRDRLEVFSPMKAPPSERASLLFDYARALRAQIGSGRTGWPWGVVACPRGADAHERKLLQVAGSALFERLLLVDEPHLIAMEVLEDPFRQRALVVDIGERGIRASVVGGFATDLKGRQALHPSASIPKGGAWVDERLRSLLLKRYPDLFLTDVTVAHMKEETAFTPPANRVAKVKVMLGGEQQTLDISEILREACEPMAQVVVEAIYRVLLETPRAFLTDVLGRIYLVGGGASMIGLPERVKLELARVGFDRVTIHRPEHPRSVLAQGALKLALLVPDDCWEMPLFSYAEARDSA